MPLRICFMASEVAPLAKTGGLADVCGALAKYLHRDGHDIRLFMPLHAAVGDAFETQPVDFLQGVPYRLGSHAGTFDVRTMRLPGSDAPVYLVDAPQYFRRDALYGNAADEHLRYLLLTHAALLSCQRMGFAPQVVHCNDWHTAFAPLLLKTVFAWDRLFRDTRTLLTIHNLGYHGTFSAAHAEDVGLGDATDWLDYAERSAGRVNPLKEGIRHAHHLSTVSPTYAREIQTPEYGWGLDGLLRERAADITGILNGVDYAEWDPRNDRFLPRRYGADDLSGKAVVKKALLARLGLAATPRRRVPLVGMVSRMTSQKGFDLLPAALPPLLEAREFQLAVLGSGDQRYEEFFAQLARRHPGRIAFHRGYSDELAHWIEAAADIFLMPSLYEPCGLNQLYSLRYGTIPVVRRTGGLADSVRHFDPATGVGTGVVFNDYDAGGIRWALGTALDWHADGPLWARIVSNAMAEDFSWEKQVGEYVTLYGRLVAARG